MAIHWLARVPWAEIIANAPRIVAGARSLSAFFKKSQGTDATPAPEPTGGSVEQDVARLKARIRELEAAQAQTAQVIQSLADNSEKMAEAVTSLRRQAVLNFRLAVACAVGIVALVAVFATA